MAVLLAQQLYLETDDGNVEQLVENVDISDLTTSLYDLVVRT